MAQSLTQSVVNRITAGQPADYKDEAYSGNLNVASINGCLVHSRKVNVRVYGRNTSAQTWTSMAVVGMALDEVDGLGTEYLKHASLDVSEMDRISIVSLGVDTSVRVIYNPVLPASIASSGAAGASVTEHAMTTLVTGEAQTVTVGAGDAFVQVFAGDGSTLEATTAHTIAHDSTAGTVTITPASNVANAKIRIVK